MNLDEMKCKHCKYFRWEEDDMPCWCIERKEAVDQNEEACMDAIINDEIYNRLFKAD